MRSLLDLTFTSLSSEVLVLHPTPCAETLLLLWASGWTAILPERCQIPSLAQGCFDFAAALVLLEPPWGFYFPAPSSRTGAPREQAGLKALSGYCDKNFLMGAGTLKIRELRGLRSGFWRHGQHVDVRVRGTIVGIRCHHHWLRLCSDVGMGAESVQSCGWLKIGLGRLTGQLVY